MTQIRKVALITGVTGQDGSYLAEFLHWLSWSDPVYSPLAKIQQDSTCSSLRNKLVAEGYSPHQ